MKKGRVALAVMAALAAGAIFIAYHAAYGGGDNL